MTRFRPKLLGIAALLLMPSAIYGQNCTHLLAGKNVVDLDYYEGHGYKIGKIIIVSPFEFFFLIAGRLEAIKKTLPIEENGNFSKTEYDAAAAQVKQAVTADSAFGQESPVKLAVVTANLANCNERGEHETVDVVYYVFSTDPIPALRPNPERRATSTEQSAPAVAERNTAGQLKLVPLGGYNHSFRGFGGGEAVLQLPGKGLDDFRFRGAGSATSLFLNGELNGSSTPNLGAMNTIDYHVAYNYAQNPTQTLSLKVGTAQGRFTGTSRQLDSGRLQTKLRYGLSLEQGLQQSNVPSNITLPNTIANSAYGALRLYAGATMSTRYSETIASYGLDIGGAGLTNLNYVKQVGDFSFNFRFPGSTHSPWDLQARASGGVICGGPILLNDRFFGGNVVAPFIPGDSWLIPDGPVVRSITANYLNGTGFGGTSFYSTNITFGKVIKSWPLIPDYIEKSDGFASGLSAAEDTAEGFFYDRELAASNAMKHLVTDYRAKFTGDLDDFKREFADLSVSVPENPKLKKAIGQEESAIRRAQVALSNLDGEKLRQLCGKQSQLEALLNQLPAVLEFVPEHSRQKLQALQEILRIHLQQLQDDLNGLEDSPEGIAARAKARKQMEHPREVVDTLQHEANMFALSIFGIFDTGRIWPDANGTRYAYGGGVRMSVVNVNFGLGYAVNPNPLPTLHQGNGAVLFMLTYTNLFR